jgi:chemotaxis protein methyltransferase CheR
MQAQAIPDKTKESSLNTTPAIHSEANREFELNAQNFSRVRSLIYQRAGIALAESKHEMVYSRLARRLRATGMSSFTEYLNHLESTRDSDEWQAFTNALTTNLTAFFRESHHFPILEDYVRQAASPISIWCAASSTGEEPYSIAMTVCEAFGTLKPPVEIIATDIDTNVLAAAASGIYTMDRIEKLSTERLKKFFLKGKGSQQGKVRVRDELRQLITFKPLNLLADGWPVSGPLDVIFCRNVMIYFDKPTQARILERFSPLMKSNGLMFAGHSENFMHISDAFRLKGKTVYEPNHQRGGQSKSLWQQNANTMAKNLP